MKTFLSALFFIALAGLQTLGAQCAPVSARLGVSGDDTTQVWVNGSYLGSRNYCNLGTGGDPATLFFPLPLEKLPGPQVCLAFETLNVNPVLVFSSWELEVDCAGAKPFVVNNDNPQKSGVSLYWDPTGGGNCGLGAPPPVDAQGNVWADPGYNPSSSPFTLTGSVVTTATWSCAKIKDALTGVPIPYISYNENAAGSGPTSACGILYWRQVAQLPAWIMTSTPTRIFTPIPIPTATPVPTLTPLPTFTWTPTPRPRARRTPTPLSPLARVAPQGRRARVKPTATFAPLRPTATWTPLRLAPWTPTPPPALRKPASLPAWLPPLVKDQVIVFQMPPVEIYVTFGDGPGRYQLEVVDARGDPLQLIFDKRIVGEGDSWATWDGKDGRGRDAPVGQYFVIFYKDGRPLRSISVYRSGKNDP